MKKFLVLLLPVLLVGCVKEINIQPPPVQHPQMRYTDLNDVPIKFGQQKPVNLDNDNSIDLLFSTVLVGDPILRRDRRQYYVNASYDEFLLSDEEEKTPTLNNGDNITINDHPGYNWFNASSVVLAEKIIEETGPEHWEGNWKNASHKFLAVQIRRNNLCYTGWVEASFNTGAGELILHRAAIALEPGKTIKAGR